MALSTSFVIVSLEIANCKRWLVKCGYYSSSTRQRNGTMQFDIEKTLTARLGDRHVGKVLRDVDVRQVNVVQANSPPSFAFTRGVSSEEDIM